MNSRLHFTDVVKRFGGRTVVDIPDLTVEGGGIQGLIGPNGAGKTTLVKLVVGAHQLDHGTIAYQASGDTHQVSGRAPDEIARLGIVKSNQVIQDFPSLTLRESLLLCLAPQATERFYRIGTVELTDVDEEIDWYLNYFDLGHPDRRFRSAGEKKLLDIIRCLMVRPRFLLLDEPTAGLPERETERVKRLLRKLTNEQGISVLIIEHNLELMWEMCDYVYFMAEGSVQLQGAPEEIRRHSTVIEKYLGTGSA